MVPQLSNQKPAAQTIKRLCSSALCDFQHTNICTRLLFLYFLFVQTQNEVTLLLHHIVFYLLPLDMWGLKPHGASDRR